MSTDNKSHFPSPDETPAEKVAARKEGPEAESSTAPDDMLNSGTADPGTDPKVIGNSNSAQPGELIGDTTRETLREKSTDETTAPANDGASAHYSGRAGESTQSNKT